MFYVAVTVLLFLLPTQVFGDDQWGRHGPQRRGGMIYDYEEGEKYVNHTITLNSGWQMLFQHNGSGSPFQHVWTFNAAIDYAAVSFRTGMKAGPDFFELNAIGLLTFIPSLFVDMGKASWIWYLLGVGCMQWPFPICKWCEFSVGWDAPKLVFYGGRHPSGISADVNGELNFYFTDNLYGCAYYECNFMTYYGIVHACGLKLGWLF